LILDKEIRKLEKIVKNFDMENKNIVLFFKIHYCLSEIFFFLMKYLSK
jgi:hypothetical protein